MAKYITPTDMLKATLQSALKSRNEWTQCGCYRCVMNTGWAAGDESYKCKHGLDIKTCGVFK